MEYRKLGNSGAVVSALCLGTMTFGAEADEATSHRILDDYVAAGGNFIDTADVYCDRRLGEDHRPLAGRAPDRGARRWWSRPRAASRWGRGRTTSAPRAATSAHALDASLKRLGIEQIDLYQMHAWDALTPIEETLRFLDDAIARRQDRLLRLLELPRLARHQGRARGARRTAGRRR